MQLFAALESHGWQWRDDFIYPPYSSMRLHRSQPWTGDLCNFHERMCGRLLRSEQADWAYPRASDHEYLVADTRGLVDALPELFPS